MPIFLRPYFWDVQFNSLNSNEDKNFIISRLLEKGRIECLKWLFAEYSNQEIKITLQNNRNISLKTKKVIEAIIA